MALKKLTLSEAGNLPCSVPDSVINDCVDGLRPFLEKHGLIQSSPQSLASASHKSKKKDVKP